MKKTIRFTTENGNKINLVTADIKNEKIFVTKETFMDSFKPNDPAGHLIRKYRKKYPDFKVEVNDDFFVKKFFKGALTSTI